MDEDGILIRVSENPGVSTRRLSVTTGRGFYWRNNHLWDSEKPHPIKERHFQREFKVNI
ncbi:hypothetical protein NQ318_010672 [Aromia moschata]|uniref:Uncharacterized protein n=1 Tax=Aromia moschata TaxID=1265417 RepID=A0AAV8XEH5_9CUCU|nr:hypothetical protein NQ318_010672 [Aromia moschata]